MVTSSQETVGIGLQGASLGAVAPTLLEPIEPGSFRASPEYEQILDEGRRGIDAKDFRAVQGVGSTEIQWSGMVRQGSSTERAFIGELLNNLLTTGSLATQPQIGATGNYDHRLRLGTTKEYLTVQHQLGITSGELRYGDARVTELTFTFDRGEGALRYRATLTAQAPTQECNTSLTDNAQDPHRGWEAQVDVAAASNMARLLSAEITLRRRPGPFYASGNSQSYTDILLDVLEATASCVFDYSVVTEIDLMLDKTQGELSFLFNIGGAVGSEDANTRRFAIGGILADFGDGPAVIDTSNINARLTLACRYLYTTSNGPFSSNGNAAVAQNSPIEVQIVQPIATGY